MTIAVNRLEGPLPTDNEAIISWVNEAVELFTPDRVVFADGSQEEWDRLAAELVEKGTLIKLNEEKRPTTSWLSSTDFSGDFFFRTALAAATRSNSGSNGSGAICETVSGRPATSGVYCHMPNVR